MNTLFTLNTRKFNEVNNCTKSCNSNCVYSEVCKTLIIMQMPGYMTIIRNFDLFGVDL